MGIAGEIWHLVEARRDDGATTMFKIRELEPRLDQPQIFVIELPYPITDLSRMPDASSYRRFATFEEQWLGPACSALGWTAVAVKIEDGSFFVYLYGQGPSLPLIERLSPFDGALGFFEEVDPLWSEYGALRELLEEAKAISPSDAVPEEILGDAFGDTAGDTRQLPEIIDVADLTRTTSAVAPRPRSRKATTQLQPGPARSARKATSKPSAKPRPKAKATAKPTAQPRTKPTAKPRAKASAKPRTKAKAKAKATAKPRAKAKATARPRAKANASARRR